MLLLLSLLLLLLLLLLLFLVVVVVVVVSGRGPVAVVNVKPGALSEFGRARGNRPVDGGGTSVGRG